MRLFGNHWRYYVHLPRRAYDATHTALLSFVQRGRRGWADADTWNQNTYVARVIGEMTAYTARREQGCPYPFSEHEGGFDAWKAYLREISQAFLDYAAFMSSEDALQDIGNQKHAELVERMKHLFDHYSSIID